MGVSNLSLAIHFVLTIVLSRLLTPDDIGVFSMSAILIAIAHVFRDFGVTTFIKRVETLDGTTVRTARTLLVLSSTAMAGLMYLNAGEFAIFFGEPRVEEVVEVLALGFLFIPFGAIASAILTRETQVTKTNIAVLVSAVVYFVSSVVMALHGFDHMTMAWANFISILCHGTLVNLLLGNRFPWSPSLRGWRDMSNFGVGTIVSNLAKILNTAIPDIALGRLSNPTAVGLFSRANGTVTIMEKLLQPPINYFTLPHIAKVHHAAGDVEAVYLRVASIVQCLMFPALAWIGIMAPDLILLLYGPQWVPASTAVPWLCLAIGISSSFVLATPTLMGVGRPYAPVWPLLVMVISKLIMIILTFDGTLSRFAMSLAFGELLGVPAYLWVLHRYIHLEWRKWLSLNVRMLVYLLPVSFIVWASSIVLADYPGWLRLLSTAVFSGLMHGALFLIVNLPIREELRILKKHAIR